MKFRNDFVTNSSSSSFIISNFSSKGLDRIAKDMGLSKDYFKFEVYDEEACAGPSNNYNVINLICAMTLCAAAFQYTDEEPINFGAELNGEDLRYMIAADMSKLSDGEVTIQELDDKYRPGLTEMIDEDGIARFLKGLDVCKAIVANPDEVRDGLNGQYIFSMVYTDSGYPDFEIQKVEIEDGKSYEVANTFDYESDEAIDWARENGYYDDDAEDYDDDFYCDPPVEEIMKDFGLRGNVIPENN